MQRATTATKKKLYRKRAGGVGLYFAFGASEVPLALVLDQLLFRLKFPVIVVVEVLESPLSIGPHGLLFLLPKVLLTSHPAAPKAHTDDR